jgi:hypothetical protein
VNLDLIKIMPGPVKTIKRIGKKYPIQTIMTTSCRRADKIKTQI